MTHRLITHTFTAAAILAFIAAVALRYQDRPVEIIFWLAIAAVPLAVLATGIPAALFGTHGLPTKRIFAFGFSALLFLAIALHATTGGQGLEVILMAGLPLAAIAFLPFALYRVIPAAAWPRWRPRMKWLVLATVVLFALVAFILIMVTFSGVMRTG